MYTFVLQAVDFLQYGAVHFFALFFLFVWARWVIVAIFAAFYAPIHTPYHTSTSVIIPVVNEPVGLFRVVLRQIVRSRPDEVIVVINGPRNLRLEQLCKEFAPLVRYVWTEEPGKRNALEIGIGEAKYSVSVLVDSDTVWFSDTLVELIKPFIDPRVGGVTTHQRIALARRNTLTRIADWLEDVRARGTMAAMSVRGKVGCLPGRTIAFRTSFLKSTVETFRTERFLGLHKEVSDDRSLTNLALRADYKTVYQSTARVRTDAPTSLRVFIRQQIRWAEGSQYNNLRMFGWMLRHAPLMFYIYISDMLIPFFLLSVYVVAIVSLFTGTAEYYSLFAQNIFTQIILIVGGALVSIGLRHAKHFYHQPIDLLYLPLFVGFLTFIMTPIRIIGFYRLADDLGWGTRVGAYAAKQ